MTLRSTVRKILRVLTLGRFFRRPRPLDAPAPLASKSTDELLSLMRHESHRIEKAVYKNILDSRKIVYRSKHERVSAIYQLLKDRGVPDSEPTLVWSHAICDAFDSLENDFIAPNSRPASRYEPDRAAGLVEFVRSRRSVRVWAEKQPSDLVSVALAMIDAARWAPNSGNRQPWRFLIIESEEEKRLLLKIKEEHCISAPLLIFVGMDTRVYGALGPSERSIYIDAGAAIMQMVLLAHKCGLGVCWNHFADDLIVSRRENQEIYSRFAAALKIPSYVTPIAIVAIGVPKFIPAEPARMEIDRLLLRGVSCAAMR